MIRQHVAVVARMSLVVLCCSTVTRGQPALPDGGYALGDALRSSVASRITVRRYPAYVAPGQKGVIQRSILDFSDARRNIQVAFVLDATNTMRADIRSLKQNLVSFVNGMRSQVKGVSGPQDVFVEIAIVIYRDLWKKYDFHANQLEQDRPHAAEVLSHGDRAGNGFFVFDRDLEQIIQTLQSISLEPGDPGFPEQVDRGVYAALTQLQWAADDDVTRVIVVAGDAPPWDEQYTDYRRCPRWWTYWEDEKAQPRPLRGYTTAELAELARSKGVTICTIACNSGVTDRTVFERHRPELQKFFRELAEASGGTFLDLEDPRTVRSLQQMTGTAPPVMLELKSIPADEIERRKTQSQVAVAVLPPFPLTQMKFIAYEDDRLDFFTALLDQFRRVEGRNVPGLRTLRRAWSQIARQTAEDDTRLAALADRLGVDFVIWGSYSGTPEAAKTRLVAIGADGQTRIESQPVAGPLPQLPDQAFAALLDAMREAEQKGVAKAAAFVKLYGAKGTAPASRLAGPLATPYRLLQESLQLHAGTPEAKRKTEKAIELLRSLVPSRPDDAFAWMLLADCYLNLGRAEKAAEYLTRARQAAQRLPESDPDRLEIEADFALFVQHDPLAAIERYEKIVAASGPRKSDSVRRALWMLAGLYLGDWGAGPQVGEKFGDRERLDRARDAIIELLVDWPDSDEAAYYQRYVHPPVKRRKMSPDGSPLRYAQRVHKVVVPSAGRTKFAQTSVGP
ncbi:MAG: tetratricopeptide repeat protein [Planctomycetes bacterium]|nr:tetratricopeptide repeat protein [Planctomycetota bacterium]